MHKRRNIYPLLAGAAIIVVSAACGFGASAPGSAAPAPTEAVSALLPTSGAAPAATEQAQAVLPTASTATPQKPTEALIPAPPAAIPEMRRVTLEYPPHIRAGDSDVIRLTLEVDSLGNVTPTAETPGNVVKGQTVQIPNLYDTHDVVAEARLDLAGVNMSPSADINEPLLPGQSVSFYWSVQPSAAGTYRGTVWLILHFIDKVTKAETSRPISAQSVQISTSSFLGLTGGLARTLGGVGSVLGAVLGIPFADEMLKWLWKRVRGGA